MGALGEFRGRRKDGLRRNVISRGHQKFGKGHGDHVEELDPPHWKRYITHGEFQQGPGGDDMKFGTLFVEISQGHEGARAALDFVKKQEVFSGDNPRIDEDFELRQDPFRRQVAIEHPMPVRMLLQIDHMRGTLEMAPAEVQHRPGFAHLPGAANDERLAPLAVLPGQKLFRDEPFHDEPPFGNWDIFKIQGNCRT